MAKNRTTEGSMALQEKKCRVITIEATESPQNIKLRVAAYARVSSASDDQLNSFAAQNRYYISLISSKENWSMVDIYADEGITGTSAEKREDFQRLLADCRRGLIDKVLVKSISRFARNTKECLESIRELKTLGVGVCFEKENIDTSTMSGEMMTALFASFAQAESESISGNMRWNYQRRMQSGEFITCKAPFGYHLKNGTLEIKESEAKIVQQIFDMYLSGYSKADIAAEITKLGVPTRDGKQYWQQSSVTQISQAVFYRAFCCLYYNLKHHGNPILNTMLTSLQAIRSRQMLWSLDVIELNKQISELTSQNQMLATLKQQGLIDPDIFISQSNELTKKLRTVKLEKERLLAADGDNTIVQTRELMEILDDGPDFLNSFDAGLFGELVDKIIVDSNEQLRFRLKNGLELVETIERTVR